MRSISDTINRLHRMATPQDFAVGRPADLGTLTPFSGFGANPGKLDAFLHGPLDLPPGSPLVVVLHGCTQSAAGYGHGAGWSTLADRHGFAVLFPQQRRANNANLCFNWFVTADGARTGGEAESVRQMVGAAIERLRIDPARVFVTGLSAGGAMTSAMLATAPELFAGGAVVAGLPFGVAGSAVEAFDRMRGHGYDGVRLGDLVRRASGHPGPWPSISVWHGTADATVDPINAGMIVDQWRDVHRLTDQGVFDDIDGHRRRRWRDGAGRVVIEEVMIRGLGHGTPITTIGDEACGARGPYLLEAGISSTYRIAASWGIVPETAPRIPEQSSSAPRPHPARLDPTSVINDALSAAGLWKPL